MRCDSGRPLLEGLEARQLLATFLVDLALDESDGSVGAGDLSLREAVELANAAPDADVIKFTSGLAGVTLVLTLGEIGISESVLIIGEDEQGEDAGVTISGGDASRIFSVTGGEATLEGLAFTGGNAGAGEGGAVHVGAAATAVISGCTLTGNVANRGGAIAVDGGSVAIEGTTISGNTALDSGGAVYADTGSTTVIVSSTLSGNAGTSAGAIRHRGASLVILNSTLSGNQADTWGGAIFNQGPATITAATITDNVADFDGSGIGGGGGVYASSGTVLLTDTIVAENAAGALRAANDIKTGVGGVSASSASNLIGDAASAGGLSDGVNGNIVGHDPLLAALADNGGVAATHALLPGSPALQAGSGGGGLATDQRGYGRSAGGAPDIGAFEAHAPTVASLSLSVATIHRGEELTLTAEGVVDGDENLGTIAFYADLDGDGVGDAGELLGSDSDGADGYALTLDGSQTSSLDVGDVALLVVAADLLGYESAAVGAVLTVAHRPPSIDALASDVARLSRGDSLTLTATGVNGGDDAVATVRFYLDSDGDGAADSGELLGSDGDGTDGYALALDGPATGAFDLGSVTLLAVAIDATGATSEPVSVVVSVDARPPSVSELTTSVATLRRGESLGLQAAATAGDSALAAVRFYHDADGDGVAEAGELLGSDVDGSDGFALELGAEETLGLPIGEVRLLAVAEDALGLVSDAAAAGVEIVRRLPSIGAVSTSAGSITRGQPISIEATGVDGGDGAVAQVRFYLDANGDGLAQESELLGADADGADGYSLELGSERTGSLSVGEQRLLAVAVDGDGFESEAAAAAFAVFSAAPTIAGARVSGAGVEGEALLLIADGVSDLGGGAAGVWFYLDADGDGVADAGELLGVDTEGSDGYSLALSGAEVSAVGRGEWTVLAVAADAFGTRSEPASVALSVEYSLRAGEGGGVQTVSTGSGHFTLVRNLAGDLVVFVEGEGGWEAVHLRDRTGSPAPSGDGIIWSDPKDGLVYVAAPSDAGFLLFARAGDGAWSFVNLSLDLGLSDAGPTGMLTQFVSTGATGRAVVVAGVNASGDLVAFRQQGGGGWGFVNISDDLRAQGMATPALVSITSYVTPWNAWTIAGIDGAGDIQGVWIAPASFDRWRVDNLSRITGAPGLTGQLTVTQTAWGAINVGGVNSQGRLVVTWWLPGFGGAWRTSDLTGAAAGPALAPGVVTGFVTPWGGINYAGLDGSGEVAAYWWTPSTGGWRVSSLSAGLEGAAHRPAGALTGHVSAAGVMSIAGAASSGEVVRLWWSPEGDASWRLEDLTAMAERV